MKKLRFTITDDQIDVMFDKETYVKNTENVDVTSLVDLLLDYKNLYNEYQDNEKIMMDTSDEVYEQLLSDNEEHEEELDILYNKIVAQFRPINVIKLLMGDVFEFNETEKKLYFKGESIPVPQVLADKIIALIQSNQISKFDYLVNFAKRCLANPDPVAREGLYSFLMNQGHRITKQGYFIAYKAVYKKEIVAPFQEEYMKFVRDTYAKRVSQKKGTKNVRVVLERQPDNMMVPYLRSLGEGTHSLFDDYMEIVDWEMSKTLEEGVYTDIHSKTFTIRLNEPVTMPREECDSNPNQLCSRGLHVGNLSYVKEFGHSDRVIHECVVDPADVVAVPRDYNNTKMRVCKYTPVAVYGHSDSDGNVVDDREFNI
jgi:hypothetical protein